MRIVERRADVAGCLLVGTEQVEVAVVCAEAFDLVGLALLVRDHPDTGVVAVTRRLSLVRLHALRASGVAAIVRRGIDRRRVTSLVEAVAHGARGGMYLADSIGPGPDDVFARYVSQRELPLVALLAESRSLREIASVLGVELPTVKSRAQSIYRKIAVADRRELRALLVSQERLQSIESPATRLAFRRHRPPPIRPGWGRRIHLNS
jgi:DNA-binding NarL/FixJ family response regulator